MKQNTTNYSSPVLIGWFIGGATVGAAIALLLAPQTGERTRRKLGIAANDGQKSLLQTGQEIVEKGRELFEKGREIAEETAQALERARKVAEKQIEDRF